MKKPLVAGISVVVVGVSVFGVIQWQSHSKKVAKCQAYLDRMDRFYESDIERTMSRIRLLSKKRREGNLTSSDIKTMMPILRDKMASEVAPALTDIRSTQYDLEENCEIPNMITKGEILAEKYQSLADLKGFQLDKPGTGKIPKIFTESDDFAIALSKHLNKIGAVLYTTYWDTFGFEQLLLFGKSAVKNLKVIQCAPDGQDAQPQRCEEVGIEGFPTWTMPGLKESGIQSLERLAEMSGYKQ